MCWNVLLENGSVVLLNDKDVWVSVYQGLQDSKVGVCKFQL